MPTNATNSKFKYTSSDTSVATISNTGVITAIDKGTAVITVAATNGIKDVITVNVTKQVVTSPIPSPIPITEILLSEESVNLQAGQTKQLKAIVLPLNANQEITWVSGNDGVAKVSSTGLVTAIEPGKTTVTAISKNGLIAKLEVKVQFPPITGNNVIMSMVSDSIKVYLEKGPDYHITRIWLSDPGKQIHKAGGIGLQTVSARMSSIAGLNHKIVVATNGSGFHSTRFDPDPKYNGSALGRLIITEGEVLRNDPDYNENLVGYDSYYYYLFDKDGKLSVTGSSASESKHQNIISTTVNTFAFYPVYVANGEVHGVWGSNTARRQALCQIDANNYAIVTTNQNATLPGVAKVISYLGCHTAVNLDGGGSTTLLLKNSGQSMPGKILVGGTRQVADALYFTEL